MVSLLLYWQSREPRSSIYRYLQVYLPIHWIMLANTTEENLLKGGDPKNHLTSFRILL